MKDEHGRLERETQADLQEVRWPRKMRGEMTTLRSLSLVAALPDFPRFRSPDSGFFLTIFADFS